MRPSGRRDSLYIARYNAQSTVTDAESDNEGNELKGREQWR